MLRTPGDKLTMDKSNRSNQKGQKKKNPALAGQKFKSLKKMSLLPFPTN